MPDCRAACQHSEEECVNCLGRGMPKLVTQGGDLADLAHRHGKIPEDGRREIHLALEKLAALWAIHFPDGAAEAS